MLGRRELSEKQIRQRLARRAYDAEAIDAAVARLRSDRSLDDARVAGALARQEVLTRRHGRLRAARQLEAAGIAADAARRALDEVFQDVDHDALIAAALDKRLRGNLDLRDAPTFRRLYRYLIGQGFEPDRALATLRARRRSGGPRGSGTLESA